MVNLLPALGKIDRENRYLILVTPRNARFIPALPDNFETIVVGIPLGSNILRGGYEQCLLPSRLRRENVDLLYSPADLTPLRSRTPVVLAMRNPNLYGGRDREWSLPNRFRIGLLKFMARRAGRKADKIIFVSASSRDAIAERLGLPLDRCAVVHHGIDARLFAEPAAAALPPEIPERCLLSISTIYHYKNFLRLLEAYLSLLRENRPPPPPLVIAGGNADEPYYRQMLSFIERHGLREKIVLPGNIPYPSIPALYARAEAFVFPSRLETFGHPSLEAMAAGVPVAAADIPVMREILGPAALYFSPDRAGEIAGCIRELLDDGERRRELIARGRERVLQFTWERSARETLAIFRETARRRQEP